MNKLNETKIAINSLALRIAELADFDTEKYHLSICVVIDEDVVVVNVGEKKITTTTDKNLLLSENQIKLRKKEKKIIGPGNDNFYSFFQSCCMSSTLSLGTKNNYLSTLKYLQDFSSMMCFQDINYKLIVEFENFLIEHDLRINTIAKHMKQLKRIINSAINMRLIEPINYPFKNYHIKVEKTLKQHLCYEELDTIWKMRELLSEEEKGIADAFLFSCYTGLRFSDIKNLSSKDFQTINRQKWIVKKMQKTNTEVRIPLEVIFRGKAIEILKERRYRRGQVFKLPANYKTNRILKKICKICKIKKNISFHCARHTAATMLLYDGINISTVQKLLGHKSVRQTEVYCAVTDNTILKELKKVKKKMNHK